MGGLDTVHKYTKIRYLILFKILAYRAKLKVFASLSKYIRRGVYTFYLHPAIFHIGKFYINYSEVRPVFCGRETCTEDM